MSRKLTKVDFARIWGEVSRLSVKDWDALVLLRQGIVFRMEDTGKERKPRKPRGSDDVPTVETESVVKKMRLRRGDGSLASETPGTETP